MVKFQNLIKSSKKTKSLSKDEIKEKFSIELQSNLGLRSQDEVVDRYFNKLSNQVFESEFNESIIKLKELLNIKLENINLISVTNGPGLSGALLTGVCFAKGLGLGLGIPVIPINHLEAHIFSNFLHKK